MDLIINQPLSFYNQLASFCFLCAGNFSDILVVRLCLLGAYICLFANAALGSPLWPSWHRPHHVSADALCWGTVCLYVHAYGVYNLLFRDERPVVKFGNTSKKKKKMDSSLTESDELTDEEQEIEIIEQGREALWLMLYRMGGMSRLQYKHKIVPHYKVLSYHKGQVLPTGTHFFILYKGLVQLQSLLVAPPPPPQQQQQQDSTTGPFDEYDDNDDFGDVDVQPLYQYTYGSGAIFDFKELGLLYNAGRIHSHTIRVTVLSESVTVFQFRNETIRNIATQDADLKRTWQTVFIGSLTRLALRHMPGKEEEESVAIQKKYDRNPSYIDNLFKPLHASEQPTPYLAGSGRVLEHPIQHICYYVKTTFSPPWPFFGGSSKRKVVGVRHRLPAPLQDLKRSYSFTKKLVPELKSDHHTTTTINPATMSNSRSSLSTDNDIESNYDKGSDGGDGGGTIICEDEANDDDNDGIITVGRIDGTTSDDVQQQPLLLQPQQQHDRNSDINPTRTATAAAVSTTTTAKSSNRISSYGSIV